MIKSKLGTIAFHFKAYVDSKELFLYYLFTAFIDLFTESGNCLGDAHTHDLYCFQNGPFLSENLWMTICLQEINKLQGRKSDFQDLEEEREEINKRMQVSLGFFVNNPFWCSKGG